MTLCPELPSAATWSVMLRDLATGDRIDECTPANVLQTASVGKLFTLVEVARRLEDKTLADDTLLEIGAETPVADSGLIHLLAQPTLSIADVCVLVGAVSDNLGANMLLSLCGLPAVQEVSHVLGYRDSRLLDWVRNERTPEMPWALSQGTAEELSDFVHRVATGTLISPEISNRLDGWLANNTDLSMVASAFDLDPLAHQAPDAGIVLRNKTGTVETARIDVGWVRNERTGTGVAFAVLANWQHDGDVQTRHEVLEAMRAIGVNIRRHIAGDR